MSYSTNLNDQGIQKIIEKYKEFELPPTNNYTLFRAKYKSCTITIFKTKTILFQGINESSVSQEICALADIEIAKEKSSNSSLSINLSLIGSDEVGTGDFFGGIVVAASYIPIELIPAIRRLGVKDSKELTDSKIQEIAPILMEKVKYSVLLLDNMKYNYVTKVKNMNMNKIKALLHNSAIRSLINKIDSYDGIVIDAFTPKDKYFEYLKDESNVIKDVELIEKAESKYICVAVSSIIARFIFLKHMDELSKKIGFELPKGAGPKVDLAIQKILKTNTVKYLDNFAKTNFKNLEKLKK